MPTAHPHTTTPTRGRPPSNYGGQTSTPAHGIHAVRFTVPHSPENLAALIQWLGSHRQLGHGWGQWYTQSWRIGRSSTIAANSSAAAQADRGILCDITGRDCADPDHPIMPLIHWALEQNAHFSRIDLYKDDHHGHLTRQRLTQAWQQGNVATRWRSQTLLERTTRAGAQSWTIYLGKRSSAAFVRIYDKAAQEGSPAPNVRVEMETHNDLATAVARELLSKTPGQVLAEQLARRYRPTEPGQDRARRRETSAWWTAFIDDTAGPALLTAGKRGAHVVTWHPSSAQPSTAERDQHAQEPQRPTLRRSRMPRLVHAIIAVLRRACQAVRAGLSKRAAHHPTDRARGGNIDERANRPDQRPAAAPRQTGRRIP